MNHGEICKIITFGKIPLSEGLICKVFYFWDSAEKCIGKRTMKLDFGISLELVKNKLIQFQLGEITFGLDPGNEI